MRLPIAALMLCLAGAPSAQMLSAQTLFTAIPPAPAFPTGDTVDTIQGVKIADPWRALENWDDPKV